MRRYVVFAQPLWLIRRNARTNFGVQFYEYQEYFELLSGHMICVSASKGHDELLKRILKTENRLKVILKIVNRKMAKNAAIFRVESRKSVMLGYKYLVPILLATFAHVAWAESETVDVKYRGTVDLRTFECRDTPRSSFIQRVCYDKAQSYMIISLKRHHTINIASFASNVRRFDGRAVHGSVLQPEDQGDWFRRTL